MFSQMNQSAQQMEKPEEKDSFGGNVKQTGVYPATIDLAFIKTAASGALMFNIVWLLEDGSKFSMQECIQSGNEKGNKPYYVKDGRQIALPGFTTISAITEMLMNKPLDQFQDSDAETKTIKLYDATQGKEVPQDVPFITALKGKQALLGLHCVETNKQVKQGNTYVDTNEKRTMNVLDKVFDANGFTLSERTAQLESPDWVNKWREKYGNETIDKFEEVKATASGGMNKPAQGGSMFANQNQAQSSEQAQGSSLFNQNN